MLTYQPWIPLKLIIPFHSRSSEKIADESILTVDVWLLRCRGHLKNVLRQFS